MDKDLIKGIGHQVKGAARRVVGNIIGDTKITTDGAVEQAGGKAQVAAARPSGQILGIDVDRIGGIVHQLRGALKQGIGSVVADPWPRHTEITERQAGKVQHAVGSTRHATLGAVEKRN